MEAAARLDRRPDDDELRPALGDDARNLLAQPTRPRADDLPAYADAVRARDRGRGLEPLIEARQLPVEVRVERQLTLDDRRRDEDDSGAAIGGEAAGEIERVLRLFLVEQRHDDGAVANRAAPAREATRAAVERSEVGQLHLMSW